MSSSEHHQCPWAAERNHPSRANNLLEGDHDGRFDVPGKVLRAGHWVCQDCGHNWQP